MRDACGKKKEEECEGARVVRLGRKVGELKREKIYEGEGGERDMVEWV